MEALSPKYDPKEVEERWYQVWESRGYFNCDPLSPKKPFSIVIPPPNVTGSLHIGHALNDSLQDLFIRYKRMTGHDCLWVPGCDHAGIATQNVVERELAKEGRHRDQLGREAFIQRVWQWKEQSGSTIMRQLRRLGASCDWRYERFTMDEGLSEAVREAFIRLYDQGLIYQGDYIINWCPRCGTALSDIEAEHKETDGKLYHIRYAVKGKPGAFVTVATTRPETLMGDVAVCVHPDDERYAAFKGCTLILPVMDKEIPLIFDDYVDKSFGTGALKITPAHDANDFSIGYRHRLPLIKVMDPKGVMNENAGPYQGLDRFECRKRIVADLDRQGLLAKIEDYHHAVAHCYRCNTVVESYLSRQWFVKMKPLAERALQSLEAGDTQFMPANWAKVYRDWLDGIRDWCISRQIWWGHRIPVWHAKDGRQAAARNVEEASAKLGLPASELTQDTDVLDTWFSSGLWPFSTLGWPKPTPELARYYPTSLLVTSWDILFFWVARMTMFGLNLRDQAPFRKVFINSLVADEHGQKMSKSKGNVIDPLTKIDAIGADALRFALMSIENQSRYISLAEERLERGRNFMNKVWNAGRFMLMNLEGLQVEPGRAVPRPTQGLTLADRWILARLDAAVAEAGGHFENYEVAAAAECVENFFWKELCDWYIEAAKLRLQAGGEGKAVVQRVLAHCLERVMRLLHPICPFITEEIWQRLPHEGETLMLASWPEAGPGDPEALAQFGTLREVVYGVRLLRGEMKADPAKVVKVMLKVSEGAESRAAAEVVRRERGLLELLAKCEVVEIGEGLAKPKGASSKVAGGLEVLVLADALDLEAEKARLGKEAQKLRQYITGLDGRLSNESFTSKAPAKVIEGERQKLAQARENLAKLERSLAELA